MPIRLSIAAATLCLTAALPSAILRAQGEVLTNDALVQMVTGKVAKALILTKIQSSPNTFDVTTDGLMSLSRNKVPADVIKAAMLRAKKPADAGKEVLVNGDVVALSNAAVARDLIIFKIQSTKSAFDVSTNGLVGLQQNKVHSEVIKAMMAVPVPTETDLATELKDTGSISLYGVQFETGDATIKPESAAILSPVGAMLKSQPSLRIEIRGHTDNVGTPPANLKLSQARALAVKAYLVETFGIPAARLTAVGLGDTKPLGDNATEDGRTKNRRVEFVKK